MQIEFSDHALSQLKIRKRIKKSMVVQTITYPDAVEPSFRDRKLYRKQYEDVMLEVVVRIENDKLIIITQYILGLTP